MHELCITILYIQSILKIFGLEFKIRITLQHVELNYKKYASVQALLTRKMVKYTIIIVNYAYLQKYLQF